MRLASPLSSNPRVRLLLLAGALALVGITIVVVALVTGRHAPRPSAAAAAAPVGPTASTSSTTAFASRTHPPASPSRTARRAPAAPRRSLPPAGDLSPLTASTPVRLSVPAIGVTSNLLQLGLNQDGSVQVPPLSNVREAGWYRFSATPGSAGSAVLLGHVDSATYGQGVFFDLGALRPGDEADVTRADGRTAIFRIDRVAEYPKTSFPSQLVYGPTSYASLKLVTCGGRFDSSTGNYLDNIVAFGTLYAFR